MCSQANKLPKDGELTHERKNEHKRKEGKFRISQIYWEYVRARASWG